MFERFKRAMAGQRAGNDAFKKTVFIAGNLCFPICREIQTATGLSIVQHSEAVSTLLSAYFFDYVFQNVVTREVASAYHQTDKRDLDMFLKGAELAMKDCPSFGTIGIKLSENFLDRCAALKNQTHGSVTSGAYAELVGSWFMESLEIHTSTEVAQTVGYILITHARQTFINEGATT